jgi:hypothetical protein
VTPGRPLHALSYWCPDRARVQIVEPLLADMQREWLEHRRVTALSRGYAAFWTTWTWCTVRALSVEAVIPPPREMWMPAMRAFGMAVLGLVALRLASPHGAATWKHTLLSAAAAIGAAPMFAMLPAMMRARQHTTARWNVASTKVMLVGTFVAVLCYGWIGPRLFWLSLADRFPDNSATPAFQSIADIWRHATSTSGDTWLFQQELHHRASEVVAAILLAVTGWKLAGIRTPTRTSTAILWFVFMELVIVVEAYHRETLIEAWYPNLALIGFLTLVGGHSRLRRREQLSG